MQLHSLLLLGAIAPLALAAPSIKFCDTIGVADDCTTEVMDFGVCKWIQTRTQRATTAARSP